jgi:glutathione S-transferase
MKLYGTYPSHFTRKVRVLLMELGIPFEFLQLTKLMDTGAENFANNPLHQLPVLEDGDRSIIESDLICEYLLNKSPVERVTFFPEGDRWEHAKRLAIINGAMASGVKLIRGKRSEIPELMSYPFFQQERAAFAAAFAWIEADLGDRLRYSDDQKLSVLDISLVCLAEWAVFREFVPDLKEYPGIQRFVEANKNIPSFASTHPAKGAV